MTNQKNSTPYLYDFYNLDLLERGFEDNNVFEETLFAYLWDRIGEGTVEEYIHFLNYLLKKEHIININSDNRKLRAISITQKGYKYLKKLLKKRLEKNHKIIYYLIFHYYLKQAKMKINEARDSKDIKKLDNILNEDIRHLKKIQLAFKQSSLLKDDYNELIKAFEIEVKHIKAIFYSNRGNPECIKIYGEIVIQAKEKEKMSTIELLSLGYLAHELMFVDIEKALKFGEKAYILAKESNNNSLKIKNTCNYIKILFYAGKETKLNEVLEFYENNLSKIRTKRANGRIKLQLALIAITKNKDNEAKKHLENYNEKTEEADPRRYAVSLAYKGICYYIKNQSKGREQLLEAINKHWLMNDYRHLIFEILIYMWMIDNEFNGDISEIDKDKYKDIKKYSDCLKDDKYEHFIKFWKDHFHSYILSKIEKI
jgi:hypothetical protein